LGFLTTLLGEWQGLVRPGTLEIGDRRKRPPHMQQYVWISEPEGRSVVMPSKNSMALDDEAAIREIIANREFYPEDFL
jgi:hypothetical protein